MDIPWDPDSEDLVVFTESKVHSDSQIVLNLEDAVWIGDIQIKFGEDMTQYIGGCLTSLKPFTPQITSDGSGNWKFSYNVAENRLAYEYNGGEVLNLVLSDSVCSNTNWKNTWTIKPTKLKFASTDSASIRYNIVKKSGKNNGAH